MPKHKASYAEWLRFAREDLASAKVLLKEDFDRSGVFLLQQAMEKALKGYLVYHQQPIIKTHDLTMLIESCFHINAAFKNLLDLTLKPTEHAIANRYPDDYEPLDEEEIIETVKNTEYIITFVSSKLTEK